MLLPNIWGRGGALFAFSGMDGKTEIAHQFIGATSSNGCGLIFYTKARASLHLYLLTDIEPVYDDLAVTGDVIVTDALINSSRIRFVLLALDSSTIIGEVCCLNTQSPVETGINCNIEGSAAVIDGTSIQYITEDESFILAIDGKNAITDNTGCHAMLSENDNLCFIFTYGEKKDHSIDHMPSYIDQIIRERLGIFIQLPHPVFHTEQILRAYSKCVSVQKVNCCSPQGDIHFNWTTPDRWPHKHMWIWDSAFHSLGLRHYAPEWAMDSIKAVLDKVRPDGFLSHMMTIDDTMDSEIIQPPIIAWAAWKVYEKTEDKSFLEYCFPRIKSMLLYDINQMDLDHDGFSEWKDSCASGMDNSPRFDQIVGAAVDLNAFIVNDLRYMVQIAEVIGKADDVEQLSRLSEEMTARINNRLWDDKSGFYYDLTPEGGQIRTKTVSGFTPLFAGICSMEQAESLVRHLTSTGEFWRPFPVSSVSADEESFSDDMWRGPVWINYNYMIIEGLRRHGFNDIANNLRDITVSEIAKWYSADGIIYEYYDSEGYRSPSILHRKGHSPSQGDTWPLGRCVRDYHWTAALFIDMLLSL